MYSIRTAQQQDVDKIVNLMTAFYAESGYPFDADQASAAFKILLADDSLGQCWLIENDSVPVGRIAVSYTFSLEYFGRAAFVEDLYVKPAHRRQGLGRWALETAEAECRKRGVLALHLEVGEGNNPANALYEHFGFQATNRKLLNKRLGNVNDKQP